MSTSKTNLRRNTDVGSTEADTEAGVLRVGHYAQLKHARWGRGEHQLRGSVVAVVPRLSGLAEHTHSRRFCHRREANIAYKHTYGINK